MDYEYLCENLKINRAGRLFIKDIERPDRKKRKLFLSVRHATPERPDNGRDRRTS